MFVIIVEDRHDDIKVFLYEDKDEAVERAKQLAKEYARPGWPIIEEQWDMRFIALCYGESCYISVVNRMVHEKEKED